MAWTMSRVLLTARRRPDRCGTWRGGHTVCLRL